MIRRVEEIPGSAMRQSAQLVLEQAPFTDRVAASRGEGESLRGQGEYIVYLARNERATQTIGSFTSYTEAEDALVREASRLGVTSTRYRPGHNQLRGGKMESLAHIQGGSS